MHPWISTLGFAGTIASVAGGAIAWRRSRGAGAAERAGLAVLPTALWILTGALLCELVHAPQLDANGGRLAPSYGLREGYGLYYGPTEGPILSVIYAPFANLFYLLTTFAKEPNSAILTASALAALSFLAPCVWLLWTRGGSCPAPVKLMTIAVFGYAILDTKPACDAVFYVHGDAPAIGLAVLACWCLTAPDPGVKHLTGAAFCAALAFWTKQTFGVLLVAAPLVAWIRIDGRRAILSAVLGAAFAAAIGLVVAGIVDARAMVFNAVEVPARHPYAARLSFPSVMTAALDNFGPHAAWPVLATLFLVFVMLGETGRATWRGRLRSDPGLVALLTAAALLPASFASRIKLGGVEVAFAPTLTLVLCGAALLTISNAARSGFFAAVAPGALAGALALLAALHAWFPATLGARAERLSTASQQEAYEFAKRHPGQAYFPWFPLATILAEKKLYHSAYAVFDRELAGFRPSYEHVRSVLPESLRYIAYKDVEIHVLESYFPEFSRVVNVDGLPGWKVYERP